MQKHGNGLSDRAVQESPKREIEGFELGAFERHSMRGLILTFIAIALAAIAIQTLYYYFVSLHFTRLGDQGSFGDLFGGLNALFSGLALFGVVAAIIQQHKDLRRQWEQHIAILRDHRLMHRRSLKNAQMNIAGVIDGKTSCKLVNHGPDGARVRIRSLTRNDLRQPKGEIPLWGKEENITVRYKDKLVEDTLEIEYFDDMGSYRVFKASLSIEKGLEVDPSDIVHREGECE